MTTLVKGALAGLLILTGAAEVLTQRAWRRARRPATGISPTYPYMTSPGMPIHRRLSVSRPDRSLPRKPRSLLGASAAAPAARDFWLFRPPRHLQCGLPPRPSRTE